MSSSHHSLRHALTRTILVWAGVFFVLLSIVFMLTFDDLRGYTLEKVAQHRLSYQTLEFAKHIRLNDRSSIREESDALIQDPEIAGILLVDTSGQLVHTSISENEQDLLSFQPVTAKGIIASVNRNLNLHLYTAPIPGSNTMLYLVLDDRPVTQAIQTSTLVTAGLLFMLLALSIFALHRSLRLQLVTPVEQVRSVMGTRNALPKKIAAQLEACLPSEASDILETYEDLIAAERSMEQRFNDMLDRVPGCVWSASKGFKYVIVSSRSAQVFGLPAGQVQGFELWSWMGNEKQQQSNMELLKCAIEQQQPNLEMAYTANIDGKEHWFGENIYLHFSSIETGGEASLQGLFGISNDITHRKSEETATLQMQQQARKMEAVGTLVGGIAHEFNNMLAGIVGNIFLLKMDVEKDSKAAVRLGRIEKLGNRAAGLVDQLLAFGRKQRTSVQDVSLNPLIEQVCAVESAGLPSHIQLRQQIDDNIVVRADTAQLRQVLTSLISNAADACANTPAGEILIKADDVRHDPAFASRFPHLESADVFCLCIQDNGTGIPENLLGRVFDPFFTTKEVGQGTGMGLSMVYGLMESFGGGIDLQSEQGRGTNVRIYLLRVRHQPVVDIPDTDQNVLKYGQGETVLVADDEELLRDAASEMLEKLNYRPVSVDNGQQAVDYIHAHPDVAIILLDLIMPVMSGSEAAVEIRQRHPDLPIVFVTGYNLSDTQGEEIRVPHSCIVTKPYDVRHLSRVMAELLSATPPGEKADP